jgi:hypothetical protein
MGFQFRGCFIRAKDWPDAQALVEEGCSRWAFCRAKVIREPFFGVGISIPDLRAALPEDATDHDIERELGRMEAPYDELPSWSRAHPDRVFVFVRADCAGGTCLYDGYTCRNGAVELVPASKDGLRALVQHLGVALDDREFFTPLTRGFFDNA